MAKYDHVTVENKWRQTWDEQGTDRPDLDNAQKPFYNLMMFPYPSAEGLHVGNVFAFVGSDIQGRYHRLLGYDVFEPLGFDAFGMHSENFALKHGRHPAEMVPKNIEYFREAQLKKIGLMVDWSRQVDTTSSDYYKWTQWMFATLYKNGFAYKKKAPVNWCPDCKTVLAAEQVIDGECERCTSAVTKKNLEQWYFKTTAFAQELLDDLDTLDWSERTKTAQRNWIGRSCGSEVSFGLENNQQFNVFTTRPDTLFGVTYMVFSPEHPLLDEITTPEHQAALEDYRQSASRLSEVDRQAEGREKTGVFTGAWAINPVSGGKIPIWAADYVLMGYGTGAIMAVPAHDQRDFDFAVKFNLPITQVVAPKGVPAAEPLTEAYVGEGLLVNSGQFDGLEAKVEGGAAITAELVKSGSGETRINYRLRDWCVSRQRYWGPPIPIIYCKKCGPVAVPEQDLPVLLPYMEDYRPDGSGFSPLRRNEEFYHTTCPTCGGEATRETDVSDNFLCSAWYFYRYPSTEFNDRPFSMDRLKKWLPVDLYVGGNEHAVLHLLYSRWLCKALNKCGFLDFTEPYKKFVAHGMIVRDGNKMSKSRGNVVNPDEYLKDYGADAFRMYLMFMGAYLEGGDFREGGVKAMKSFLDRLWTSVMPEDGQNLAKDEPKDSETRYWLHSTIKAVTADIARFSYNTAIARLMELVNHLTKNRLKNRVISEAVVRMVAPLAPHVAEEMWANLGHKTTVFAGGWPTWDEEATHRSTVEYVIQINGKVRAKLELEAGMDEKTLEPLVFQHPDLAKWLDGHTIIKKIYVPDKLVNLVVKPT